MSATDQELHTVSADGAVRVIETGAIIGWVSRGLRRAPDGAGMVMSWTARYRHTGEKSYHPTRRAAVEDLIALWRLTEAAILAAHTTTTETTTETTAETTTEAASAATRSI